MNTAKAAEASERLDIKDAVCHTEDELWHISNLFTTNDQRWLWL